MDGHLVKRTYRNVRKMTTLKDVKKRQPDWFSPSNKKFFGDVDYKVMKGGKTNSPFLVRSTYAWTDMFGNDRKLHYRINTINQDDSIGFLFDDVFDDMEDVKNWLRGK